VVKLARAEKIQKEVENYYKFISRKLTGSFAANLLQRAVLWDIGGASYSFVGSDGVRTFSQYYEENSIADIEESLQSFFIGVWKKNYDHAHEQCNVSLFNLYSNVWGEWYEKRVKAFSPADFTGLSGIMQKLNIPNPVEWLKKNIAESPSDISMVASTLLAVTHGDLHGDNLMVDNKKNVWVIDFERCCEGHALQDFIELEADIFNRLEAHNNSASAYLKMCIVVLKQKNIQALETLQAGTEDTHIEKALQTIFVIRSLACQLTGITDARQYLFGLLFNMFFRADIQREKGAQSSMLRSLLIASLICHRLDHWDDETWPPVEWNL
jgi:hypothetical protein